MKCFHWQQLALVEVYTFVFKASEVIWNLRCGEREDFTLKPTPQALRVDWSNYSAAGDLSLQKLKFN